MPFEKGNPGRRKGSPNKRTRELVAVLDGGDYCGLADLIWAAAVAKDEYQRATFTEDKIACIQTVQHSALGILPYLYPRRKSVEVTGEVKLQAFSEMVQTVLLGIDSNTPKSL